MRIDPNIIVNRIQGAKFRGVKGAGGVDGLASDSVDISSRSEDFKTAMDALISTPEVREDRVIELQQQIEQGAYDTPNTAIADKLLGRGKAG
jgi:negative regulator of flagellin synthesis FlgM